MANRALAGSSLFSVECNSAFFQLGASAVLQSQRDWIIQPRVGPIREGLPWVTIILFHNPERVVSQALTNAIQPFQGCGLFRFSPRVARSSQPWAERFNPFGIGAPNESFLNASCIPLKTAKNLMRRLKCLIINVGDGATGFLEGRGVSAQPPPPIPPLPPPK